MSSVKTKTISPTSSQSLMSLARTMLGQAVGFRDCEPQALDALVQAGQLRTLGKGEYAYRHGERATSLRFLVQGLVEVSITRSDGQRHLLGLLLPGDFFNLLAVVDDAGSEYDGSTRVASVVLVVPITTVRELRAQYPSLVMACEKQFVLRARLLQKRMAVDPGVPIDTRTAGMLKLLAAVYGNATSQGVEFMVKLTQSDFADWLGLSRQRMNFVLKQLESEGLIRLQYSSLVIVDPEGLAARARH